MIRSLFAFAAMGAVFVTPAAAQGVNGAQLFKQRCQTCHGIKAGAPAVLGPNLAGVVGRKAASTPFKHSPAFAKAKLVWTKPNLDKYLAAPAKFLPGTRMVISVSDAAQRKAIIDYLATVR